MFVRASSASIVAESERSSTPSQSSEVNRPRTEAAWRNERCSSSSDAKTSRLR